MVIKNTSNSNSIRTQRFSGEKPADKSRYINPAGFSEIFISSSRLISVYAEKSWQPPTDIYETDKEVVIRSEIAGMKPEEINVSLYENRLLITGTRNEHDSRTKRNFRQMEINYGKFEKTIEIYNNVEAEKISASYKDGFLQIVIPKSKKLQSVHHTVTVQHIEIVQLTEP
ncbi:MAG: Hsp20/alpha crystallin family protein [Planctomycetota bacterium]|nr:Hsp20/alpha crystallin family protein [Planctomycetota bacterium]MDI6787992.1 Hsp20/alpha crystallin family protein [Planctomycetota bacterium]